MSSLVVLWVHETLCFMEYPKKQFPFLIYAADLSVELKDKCLPNEQPLYQKHPMNHM